MYLLGFCATKSSPGRVCLVYAVLVLDRVGCEASAEEFRLAVMVCFGVRRDKVALSSARLKRYSAQADQFTLLDMRMIRVDKRHSRSSPEELLKIVVKEDFFKSDLCNLIAKGTQAYRWQYDHKSDAENPTHNKFFISPLWNEASQENFFYMLWRMIHKEIPFVGDCYCWRIIANGQVKGQNGNWHTDHGDKTVLYFPLEWTPEWGGSTYFKIDDAETQIQYKQNQILAFDSHILHYGSSPSVDNILRVSVAFNLRINKSSERK